MVLICGDTPAYRDLSVGDEGREVRDLNENLVTLGYAKKSELDPESDHYGWETAEAVAELQDELGVDETGRLDFGDAVFLPGPLVLTKPVAEVGTRAAPGGPGGPGHLDPAPSDGRPQPRPPVAGQGR